MTANEIAIIIGAVVAGLTVLGAGIKWLVGWVVDRFLKGLDANTKAVVDASAAHVAACAAMVASNAELRMEVREMRVEVRTVMGVRPPTEAECSDDGQAPDLTPVRGVPLSPTARTQAGEIGRYHLRRKDGG
jgi:hypothetical protein